VNSGEWGGGRHRAVQHIVRPLSSEATVQQNIHLSSASGELKFKVITQLPS
jgi:hypothetical protein